MKTSLFRLFGVSLAAMLLVCSLAACGSGLPEEGKAETLEPEALRTEAPESQELTGTPGPEDEVGSTILEGQIADQSFTVELDGWGAVTFASFQPVQSDKGDPAGGGNALSGDVRFMLLSGDRAVYDFPEKAPDNLMSGAYVFQEVLAVAFQDYNEDGRTDILLLLKYGNPENGRSIHLARAYTQEEGEKEFFLDSGLTDYLSFSAGNDYTENMAGVYEGIAAYSRSYEMCTDLSAFEVERFVRRVRKLILEGEYENLAEECAYPLTVNGREYGDKEALLAANLLQNPGQDFLEALEQETCGNLFCSWQGIMLGNGEVWIQEMRNEDMTSQGLKITAFNGLH